jgi:GNAT superfamily N-acetyltransferase
VHGAKSLADESIGCLDRLVGLFKPSEKVDGMTSIVHIRDANRDDEAEWRQLWDGYNAFYETQVAPEVTSRTWERIIDPRSAIIGRIADVDGQASGFSISVLHEGTWVPGPVCYLEDLFVAPSCRGQGLGRKLIQDLVDRGRTDGWSSLYWHTRRDNPARRLYDEFVEADDFVRYRLRFE